MLIHSRWLHACICFIHPKECWGYKKSSSRNLAKVRIKTDISSIEITLTAGASGLQRWKQKSVVSHCSCALLKVLEFLTAVSVSYPSVQPCRWVGNAPLTHDFCGKGIFLASESLRCRITLQVMSLTLKILTVLFWILEESLGALDGV